VRIHFNDIANELLSPGNIFWVRVSGVRSLISKKGEAMNLDLIKKLDGASQLLVIEDAELELHKKIQELYYKYSDEVLMKDKIASRDEIISTLREEFIENKKSQLELNMIAWKLFSNFEYEGRDNLGGFDHELLKRNLTVASSYTFCAFFMGYYETNYLKKLFTTTFENLMALGLRINSLTLKQRLEYLRLQETFNEEDFAELESIGSHELVLKTMMFERYDGSGVSKMNSREMTDLEIILVGLNRTYGFKNDELVTNVLRDIEIGDLKCEGKILRMLQRVLYKKPKINVVAVAG
jgi:hypothetical protein